MESSVREELEALRKAYASAAPAARLRGIKQRLARAEGEPGPMRLVAAVSAVEALARSLVVHASGRPAQTAQMRYRQFQRSGPVELVEEVLRLRGARSPAQHFAGDTWPAFELACEGRDLVVQECTHLPQDKTAGLARAAESVLEGLVELAGLPRVVS